MDYLGPKILSCLARCSHFRERIAHLLMQGLGQRCRLIKVVLLRTLDSLSKHWGSEQPRMEFRLDSAPWDTVAMRYGTCVGSTISSWYSTNIHSTNNNSWYTGGQCNLICA